MKNIKKYTNNILNESEKHKFFADKLLYYEYTKSRCTINLSTTNGNFVLNLSLLELIILNILNESDSLYTPQQIYKYLKLIKYYKSFRDSVNNLIHVGLITHDEATSNIEVNTEWSSNYIKLSTPTNIIYL